MPKTIDIELGLKPQMYLFKGRAKSRKSTAAASFPGPIYISDCDGKIDIIKKEFPNRDDIEYDSPTNFVEIIRKKNELLDNCPYKTIIFPDSLTFFTEMLMNYSITSRGGNVKTSSGKSHKSKGEISLLEIDDYGAETRMISELLDDLKIIHLKHNTNIIVTAHIMEKEIKNMKGEVTERQQFLIAYGNKVVDKIPAAFNNVFHFYSEEAFEVGGSGKYLVRTQGVGKDFAGTAIPELPAVIDWTDENFYKTMMSYVPTVLNL